MVQNFCRNAGERKRQEGHGHACAPLCARQARALHACGNPSLPIRPAQDFQVGWRFCANALAPSWAASSIMFTAMAWPASW